MSENLDFSLNQNLGRVPEKEPEVKPSAFHSLKERLRSTAVYGGNVSVENIKRMRIQRGGVLSSLFHSKLTSSR